MKRILLLLLCGLLCWRSGAQAWTPAQLDAANTAKDIQTITDIERDVILYLNLARMYPKQFAKLEVAPYTGSEYFGDGIKTSGYKQSLLADLRKMKPVAALTFDKSMYDLAACFARESGEQGRTGHTRKKCGSGFLAECCSYGMAEGRDIAMQWLIDNGIASLGHRKICLEPGLTKVGVGFRSHITYKYCAVADFQ